jgi:hypothetical protein
MKPVRLRRGNIAVLVHVYSNGMAPSSSSSPDRRARHARRRPLLCQHLPELYIASRCLWAFCVFPRKKMKNE